MLDLLQPDRRDGRATDLHAFLTSAIQPGHDTRPDHGPFELGEDAEHLEHHPARRGGGIERLLVEEQVAAKMLPERARPQNPHDPIHEQAVANLARKQRRDPFPLRLGQLIALHTHP